MDVVHIREGGGDMWIYGFADWWFVVGLLAAISVFYVSKAATMVMAVVATRR
ncbi:unnamed protein product [Prunus armeniaca]